MPKKIEFEISISIEFKATMFNSPPDSIDNREAKVETPVAVSVILMVKGSLV